MMKKTILVPTDFSIESLKFVKYALNSINQAEKVNILLTYGASLSDNITDLLFFSKSKFISQLSNTEFDEACEVIRNKYASKINSMRKDLFIGTTLSAFENYVEANRVTEAYIPTQYQYNPSNKDSFDILPFIKKSSLNTINIEWEAEMTRSEKGQLSELFFS